MNQEVKRKWVEALRSGKYEQGVFNLKSKIKSKTQYCCLGVLCDIYLKEHNKRWSKKFKNFADKKSFGIKDNYDGDFGYNTSHLPNNVMEWAGLDSHDPKVSGKHLTVWNDEGVKDFEDIANMIEKEL